MCPFFDLMALYMLQCERSRFFSKKSTRNVFIYAVLTENRLKRGYQYLSGHDYRLFLLITLT